MDSLRTCLGRFGRQLGARMGALTLGVTLVGCGPNVEELEDGPNRYKRQAATGDPVRRVGIPAEVDCASPGIAAHVSLNVAAVPGSALPNRPSTVAADKTLLAVSCRVPDDDTAPEKARRIYFVDPDPDDGADPTITDVEGEVVYRLDTTLAPPNGWGAWSYRGDVVPPDLIACGNTASSGDPHPIYRIDLASGVPTLMFSAEGGLFPCDGLAWDAANDTIYMSPDISDTIYHYSTSGSLLGTVPVPVDCMTTEDGGPAGNSGIEVVGTDLLIGCNGARTMYQIDKVDGTIVRPFNSGADRTEDLECDRFTFGPDLSVIWSKDAFNRQFFSFEVPFGTCGRCQTEERPDLASLPAGTREEVANFLAQYIDGEAVAVHRFAGPTWHAPGRLFFGGHRGYLAGFEIWLLNVMGRPDLLPLPQWDPTTNVPSEFAVNVSAADAPATAADQAACTAAGGPTTSCVGGLIGGTDATACWASGGGSATSCVAIANTDLMRTTIPSQYTYIEPPPTTQGLCQFLDTEQLRVGGFESYHNGVHSSGAATPPEQGINGAMNFPAVSPSAAIFWPWHAWVDSVGRDLELRCLDAEAPVCSDVFLTPESLLPFSALGVLSGEAGRKRRPAMSANTDSPIGFWWWFEDDVVSPEFDIPVTVDHSGFGIQGKVHGGAALSPGKVGQCMTFDGRNDWIEVRDKTAGHVGSGDFTLDAWVKTSDEGVAPILDRRNRRGEGYAFFIDAGELALILKTDSGQIELMTDGGELADGEWHHVAAVVDRSNPDGSGLFVDGEILASFDASGLEGDFSDKAQLWIGRMRAEPDVFQRWGHFKRFRDHPRWRHKVHGDQGHHWHQHDKRRHGGHHHKHHHHHKGDKDEFFNGELDEIDMLRHKLTNDLVGSIFLAGSSGKFGSVGNLPTAAGRGPCLVELGQMIADNAEVMHLGPAFDEVIAALQAGRVRQGRRLLEELQEATEVDHDLVTFGNLLVFHGVHHEVQRCLSLRDLRAGAGLL